MAKNAVFHERGLRKYIRAEKEDHAACHNFEAGEDFAKIMIALLGPVPASVAFLQWSNLLNLTMDDISP